MHSTLRPSRSTALRGFTLGEALFICGLFFAGALILYLVGSRMRSQSETATCTYNVRQLGTGLVMYAQDHDDTLPQYTNYESQIAAANKTTAPTNTGEPALLKKVMTMYSDPGIWYCPEDPVVRQSVYCLGVKHDISSYVLPRYADDKGKPKKLSNLPNNLHYGLVWDAAGDKSSCQSGVWYGGSKSWASNHSDGSVNYVLPDLSLHRSPALLPSGVILP